LALKACRQEDIDIIYARHGGSSLAAVLLAKRLQLPLILEVNGILHDPGELEIWLRGPRWFSKLIGKGIEIMERFSLRSASKLVVCTSGTLGDSIHEKFGIPYNKMAVIDNGADIALFQPVDQKLARRKLSLFGSYRWVVFVGSLVPWLGVEKLVDAAPLVLNMAPDVRFLVVGEGPQRAELDAKAQSLKLSKKLLFTGHVAHEEVPWYINSADLCVAPYFMPKQRDWVGSPLKLFEYMACSKAIVVSDLTGIADYVKNSGSGKIVPAGDSVSLAEAVIELLNDPTSRHEMGRRGRQAVLKYYNWQTITKRIAQECENVLLPPS
jgi:glycosyltransferase involved in cell wall biosynthesis